MDYQILSDKFKLNKNKNIGKVLYIVEGESREINLLRDVFRKVLDYEEVITRTRAGKQTPTTYANKQNKNSKIAIINSEKSNIGSLENIQFIEDQVKNIKQYDLDFDYQDAAIFYIFDGDRIEDKEKIKLLIKKFINSREPSEGNEYDSIGGMLLLSYPSIEAFIISNFEKDMYKFNERFNFSTQNLKQYIDDKKHYNNNKLSENTLENAFRELVKSLKEIDVDRVNLDNTYDFNNKIFEFEVENNHQYMLSLLLISFIDLGIIEIGDEERIEENG